MIIPNIWENKKCSKPPTRFNSSHKLSYPPVSTIAMDNGPFIVDLPLKHCDVPSFWVCLPEGTPIWMPRNHRFFAIQKTQKLGQFVGPSLFRNEPFDQAFGLLKARLHGEDPQKQGRFQGIGWREHLQESMLYIYKLTIEGSLSLGNHAFSLKTLANHRGPYEETWISNWTSPDSRTYLDIKENWS